MAEDRIRAMVSSSGREVPHYSVGSLGWLSGKKITRKVIKYWLGRWWNLHPYVFTVQFDKAGAKLI